MDNLVEKTKDNPPSPPIGGYGGRRKSKVKT